MRRRSSRSSAEKGRTEFRHVRVKRAVGIAADEDDIARMHACEEVCHRRLARAGLFFVSHITASTFSHGDEKPLTLTLEVFII